MLGNSITDVVHETMENENNFGKTVNVTELTETELNAELEKGYADLVAGRTRPARQVFADIRKDNNIWHLK